MTCSKLWSSKFKKFFSWSVFEKLQFTEKGWNKCGGFNRRFWFLSQTGWNKNKVAEKKKEKLISNLGGASNRHQKVLKSKKVTCYVNPLTEAAILDEVFCQVSQGLNKGSAFGSPVKTLHTFVRTKSPVCSFFYYLVVC